MRHYEIVALVHPNQSDQLHEIIDRYRKIVEDSGGTVHRCENLGRRKLAYPIRKLLKAGYFLMNIECESAIKDEIENLFRYNDSIVRSLIIRMNKAVTKDSPLLIKKKQLEAEEAAEAEIERKRAEEIAAREAAEATRTIDAENIEGNPQLEVEADSQSEASAVNVPETATESSPEAVDNISAEETLTEHVNTDSSDDSTEAAEQSIEKENGVSSEEENPESRDSSLETSKIDETEDTHDTEQAVGETNETTK